MIALAVLQTVLLGFVVAAISMTLSKATLFGWLQKRAAVFRCPYCTSHWVSFVVSAIARPQFQLGTGPLIDWFLWSMVLVGLAPRICWWIYSSYLPMKEKV